MTERQAPPSFGTRKSRLKKTLGNGLGSYLRGRFLEQRRDLDWSGSA